MFSNMLPPSSVLSMPSVEKNDTDMGKRETTTPCHKNNLNVTQCLGLGHSYYENK
jgi:hypothetical protein